MEYDGHYIDDPLMVVNAKPDFSGIGLEPNTTELRPKQKTVRPHPLEVAAARHARFDILGWIIKRFEKARNHGNRKS